MMRRAIMCPLLLVWTVQVAHAIPRAALIYSDYRWQDRECVDGALAEGWELDHWNVVELDRLMLCLSQYDLVAFSPCWNFSPGLEAYNYRAPDGLGTQPGTQLVMRSIVKNLVIADEDWFRFLRTKEVEA